MKMQKQLKPKLRFSAEHLEVETSHH